MMMVLVPSVSLMPMQAGFLVVPLHGSQAFPVSCNTSGTMHNNPCTFSQDSPYATAFKWSKHRFNILRARDWKLWD